MPMTAPIWSMLRLATGKLEELSNVQMAAITDMIGLNLIIAVGNYTRRVSCRSSRI